MVRSLFSKVTHMSMYIDSSLYWLRMEMALPGKKRVAQPEKNERMTPPERMALSGKPLV